MYRLYREFFLFLICTVLRYVFFKLICNSKYKELGLENDWGFFFLKIKKKIDEERIWEYCINC